ncbi:hypothetical protein P3342_005769 [Pyrenophora teres f. teres]|nr:hypothetical protein P3342_005769 [Pyrenophora teres f. teres]
MAFPTFAHFPRRALQSHHDPYINSSEDANRHSQHQRSQLFAAYVQRPYVQRPTSSPFTGRHPTHSHVMGGYPQVGVGRPWPQAMSVAMAMAAMGSRGAMGIVPDIRLGMRMPSNIACHNPSSFLASSQMAYRQPALFDAGSSHPARAPFSTRRRHRGQASSYRHSRGPFFARPDYASNPFSDDDDDYESEWDEVAMYMQPRRSRRRIRNVETPRYRGPSRSRCMYDGGYEDEDDDEESDFDEYYPWRSERVLY